MPKRIQRKRTKGWRMPEGAVYVGRPTKWGNPFPIIDYHDPNDRRASVAMFKMWLYHPDRTKLREQVISELRGKDLACWCRPNQECHADVLLELANRDEAA